jgi:hypothetical protein
MPNIEQYASPEAQRGLTPSDRGSSAFEIAGRHTEAGFQQIGQDIKQVTGEFSQVARQHEAFMDVSQISATHSALFANTTARIDAALKEDGAHANTDTINHVLEGFDTSQQLLEDTAKTPEGKMHAVQTGATLRSELYRYGVGQFSAMVAHNAVANIAQAENTAAADVQTHPELIGAHLDKLEADTKAQGALLDPAASSQLNEHFVKETAPSLVLGYAQARILQNPQAVIKAIDESSDPYFNKWLDPEQRRAVRGRAKAGVEAEYTDQMRAIELRKAQAGEISTKATSDYMVQLGTRDPADPNMNTSWTKTVLGDTTLEPAARTALIAVGERYSANHFQDMNRGSPEVLDTVVRQIATGQNIPSDAEIMAKVGPGGMNVSEARVAMELAHPKAALGVFGSRLVTQEMDLWRNKLVAPVWQVGAKPDLTAFNEAESTYLPMIQQGVAQGIPIADLIAPPDAAHPNSIYHVRLIESFAAAPTPPTAATPATPKGPGLLDQILGAHGERHGFGWLPPVPGQAPPSAKQSFQPSPKAGQKGLDSLVPGGLDNILSGGQ